LPCNIKGLNTFVDELQLIMSRLKMFHTQILSISSQFTLMQDSTST